ncbi:hypothetical protein D3C75_666030 [compost metagenome]
MTIKANEVGTIEGGDTFKIPVSDYLSPEAKSVYTESSIINILSPLTSTNTASCWMNTSCLH